MVLNVRTFYAVVVVWLKNHKGAKFKIIKRALTSAEKIDNLARRRDFYSNNPRASCLTKYPRILINNHLWNSLKLRLWAC